MPWKHSAKQYTPFNPETGKGNIVVTTDAQVIIKWLGYINKNLPHVKNIIIDDNTYVTIMELQRRKSESWEKFDIIASNFLDLTAKARTLRDDIVVFFLHHTQEQTDDITQDKSYKAISFGRFTDEKLGGQETQWTVVLRAAKEINGDKLDYVFHTKEAASTAKAPFEMFETDKIPNDLAFVRKTMDCYYDGDCGEIPEQLKPKTKQAN